MGKLGNDNVLTKNINFRLLSRDPKQYTLTDKQKSAFRNPLTRLADLYTKATHITLGSSIIGGITTFFASFKALSSYTSMSKNANTALAAIISYSSLLLSCYLTGRFFRRPRENTILNQVGKDTDLKSISSDTATYYANQFSPRLDGPFGDNYTVNSAALSKVTKTTSKRSINCTYHTVKAAKTLFNHLALMPQSDEQ